MVERRNRSRLDIRLEAVVEGIMGKNDATVVDLSEAGCYVDTIAGARVGAIVRLQLLIPDNQWLILEGEIVHITPNVGFGLRFTKLGEDEARTIRTFVGNL